MHPGEWVIVSFIAMLILGVGISVMVLISSTNFGKQLINCDVSNDRYSISASIQDYGIKRQGQLDVIAASKLCDRLTKMITPVKSLTDEKQ